MSSNWLDWWGLDKDPCLDLPLKTSDLFENYFISTKNTESVRNEADLVRRTQGGYIRLVVGARGAGKTSALYYFTRLLSSDRTIFPIFVELSDYTLMKIGSYSSSHRELHASRLIASDLLRAAIKTLKTLKVELNNMDSAEIDRLSGILEGERQSSSSESIPAVATQDVTKVVGILSHYDLKVVLTVDELDKLDRSDLIELVSNYFKSEQGVFQTLMVNKACLVIGCSDKWANMFRQQDLSYMNYRNRLHLDRLSQEETKKMLEKRFDGVFKKENYRFPFSDDAIRLLNTCASGNPREIIQRSRPLLIKGAEQRLKKITAFQVNEMFGEDRGKALVSDFDAVVASSELAETGAVCIYRLASDPAVPPTICLPQLGKILAGSEADSEILDRLIRNGCVTREKVLDPQGKKVVTKISAAGPVLEFFREWKDKYKHDFDEFVEWYRYELREPPKITRTEKLLRYLVENSRGVVLKKLEESLQSFINLEGTHRRDEIILCAWHMCQTAIVAFCQEFGLVHDYPQGGVACVLPEEGVPRVRCVGRSMDEVKRKFRSSNSDEPGLPARFKAKPQYLDIRDLGFFEALDTKDPKRKILLEQFRLTLTVARSRLERYDCIETLRRYFNMVGSGKSRVTDEEAEAMRTISKTFMDELSQLWAGLSRPQIVKPYGSS